MALYRAVVRLGFAIGSGAGTNTWHLRTLAEDPDGTDVAGLMDLVKTFYDAAGDQVPSAYTWTWDGTVQQIATQEPHVVATSTPWTVLGNAAGGYTGAPSMSVVTWRTELATRSGRGRTFIGPLAALAVETNGTLSPTGLAQLRNGATNLINSSVGFANGALVVWSETDQLARDFVAFSVTDQVAVLRSRRG